MRESVSAIFINEAKNEFYTIKRKNNLMAFPGYFSFPGGKVDKEDFDKKIASSHFPHLEKHLIEALYREVVEELGVDLITLFKEGIVRDIIFYSLAITPEFNPHRFKNYYFKIFLTKDISFTEDEGEIASGHWLNALDAFNVFKQSMMLVVPPMITIIEDLARDLLSTKEIDSNLKYNAQTEVPVIWPVYGVNQYLPLSHTFPPANRTNSLFIGDNFKVLVDPSPKSDEELEKFLTTMRKFNHSPNLIFISHHHPDHHERAVFFAKHFNVDIGLSQYTYERIKKIWGENYFEDIKIRFYEDQDILTTSCGEDVVIYHTPGHDEGQLSLIRRDLAWAFVSDLIQTVGTVVVGGEEGDMKKYFTSLELIINLAPHCIIPSHGIAVGGVHKLQETLAHRKMREDSIKTYLASGVDESKLLEKIYPDLDEKLIPYAKLTILAHLKKIHSEK